MAAPGPTPRRLSRPRATGRVALSAVVAILLLSAVAACGSDNGGGGGSGVTGVPTTAEGSTTTRRSTTTTEGRTTTTRSGPTTSATSNAPTTTTTDEPTTTTDEPTTTTTRASTTTTARATTTTEKAETTSTTEESSSTSTTAATGAPASSPGRGALWIGLIALGGVLVLMLVLALRHRAARKAWWAQADALVRDGRAVTDLGSSGPASTDPQQEVAHWSTIEQRTQGLATEIQRAIDAGPPNDVTGAALAGLGQAVTDYQAALRASRTLRIGPPAPTAEQLQYADAESAQRLAITRANLDQLDQLVLPHRSTT